MSVRDGLDAIELMARIDGCLFPLEQLNTQLNAIQGTDPELKPELDAVRAHLVEAAQALRRAATFVHARYDIGNEAA